MTNAKYDVLGIGNAIFDVLVRTDEGFLAAHGMPKGGMALIDEARATAIYRDMGPATEMSGGSAANTIVGDRRASARAPPMSARSRTTRSAGSMPTTSAPPASRSRPRRRRRPRHRLFPTSW